MRFGALFLAVLVVASCSTGIDRGEYFAALESVTNTLDGRLDEVEEAFNAGLLDIDFQAAAAETELVGLFRTSITDTADSFAELVTGIRAIEPPADLAAPHGEAIAAGERVLAEFDTRAEQLAAITTLEDVDAYAQALADGPARTRFAESCRELQAIADLDGVGVDLACP